MKNKSKNIKKITDSISSENLEKQEKNKSWWEELPMTYEDWDSEKRIPKSKEDFLKIEKLFLDGNPFLKDYFDFNRFKDKKILEIGCGSGAASCLFAKGGANVTSVDITEKALEMTTLNAKNQNLKIKVLQQDAEKLMLPKNYFDYIFSWGVLHHSQNTLKAFEQLSKLLKKNGRGLIMVYNKNSLRYYINGFYWLLIKRKIFKRYTLESVQDFYTDGYYHRHFTQRELKNSLEKLGLKCDKISVTHMGTKMISFLPKKIVNWLKKKYGWLIVAEFKKK
jgi:2-polyprenyl-3-methyl-5-hydroxy-6-metoxy-1,4-benzoquinol methylase